MHRSRVLSSHVTISFSFLPFLKEGEKIGGGGGGRKLEKGRKKTESGIEPTDIHSVSTLCFHSKFLTDGPTNQHANLFSCSVAAKKNVPKCENEPAHAHSVYTICSYSKIFNRPTDIQTY